MSARTLVTVSEAARREGITPQAMGRWIRSSGLEPVPGVHGTRLFDWAALKALRAAGVRRVPHPPAA